MSLAIGVDVGGTKIAAGVVDEKGAIVELVKRPTPAADGSGTIEVISGAVSELLGRYEVEAVGIGAAGFIEQSRSMVAFAPNLAWRNEPVARQVEIRTGRPVVVEMISWRVPSPFSGRAPLPAGPLPLSSTGAGFASGSTSIDTRHLIGA